MNTKNSIFPIALTSINSNTLLIGTYKVINSSGLPNACLSIHINNHTKDDVFVSFDGINDHDFVPMGEELRIDIPYRDCNFAKLSKIYIRGTASIGYIYLSAYYLPLT